MDQSNIVSEIRGKLEKLVALHQAEKQRADQLSTQVAQLKGQLDTARTEGDNLREELKIAKISRSLSDDEMKNTDAKARINQLIKEVDRCIALLNE